MVPRNQCEKCLEHMKAEMVGDDYVLVCPNCERKIEKDEYCSG